MSISVVGTGTTGTTGATSCTFASSFAAVLGDLILTGAFRNGSTTAPSLASNNTSIKNGGANTCSTRCGYKISTGGETSSGTWTNAGIVSSVIYRSSNYATGSSLYIGGSTQSTGATTTTTFGAVAMIHTDNTSRVAAFIGKKTNADAISTHAPTGMALISGTDSTISTPTTSECCWFDTNGTVSSWSSTNVTLGTATGWVSDTIEIIENQPNVDNWTDYFVQHISLDTDTVGALGSFALDNFRINFDPSWAGNGLLLTVGYTSGATITIADSTGGTNTWTACGAAADAGAGSMALRSWLCASPSTNTSWIEVGTSGGTANNPLKVWVTQIPFAATVTGYASAANVNSGGIVSPGSLTPTGSNNLIVGFMALASTNSGTPPLLIVPESGYALNDANIAWPAQGYAYASQYMFQSGAGAPTTAQFYLNQTTQTETYNAIAIAFSYGTIGTKVPTGPGVQPWIAKILHMGTNTMPATWLLQNPNVGNTGVWESFGTSITGQNACADTDGITTWTFQNPVAGAPTAFTAKNLTAKSNRSVKWTKAGSPSVNNAIYCDIINGDPTNPIVATAAVGATAITSPNTTVGNQPSITPTGQNQLTINLMQVGLGPTSSLFGAPAGAVYDLPTYNIAKFTASMSGGTSLVSPTITWGAIVGDAPDGGGGILTGSGVSVGTTITSSSSPWTVSPSPQTFASTTITQSQTDSSTSTWGEGQGHYYNGSNLSAQSWGYNLAAIAGNANSVSSIAVIVAGPAAAGLAAPQLFPNSRKFGPGNIRPRATPLAFPSLSTSFSVTSDSGVPGEFTSNLRSDALVLLEFLASVRNDSVAQLEAIAAVRNDDGALPEFVAGLSANTAAQLEFLGSVRTDDLAPLEMVAALRSDVLVLMETGSAQRSDMIAASEILAGLRSDLVGNLEVLAAMRGDSAVPIENQGTIAVTGDGAVQLETTAALRSDSVATTEILASLRSDLSVLVEFIAATVGQSAVPLEITASFRVDFAGQTETTSQFRSDALAPGETISGAAANSAVGLESLIGVTVDRATPIENQGGVGVSANSAVPLEFGGVAFQSALEWILRARRRHTR